MYLNDIFTIPANLAGVPAHQRARAASRRGLPIGLQLTAPALDEATLLRAAHACEQARPGTLRPPRLASDLGTCAAYEDGHRARGPRRARDADEDVLRLRDDVRRQPNTRHAPVCLGMPGALPVINRRAIEFASSGRPGPRQRDRAAPASPGSTTSIPTCRRTTRSASTTCRSARAATWTSSSRTARRRASASRACTWKRTSASSCTRATGRIHDADAASIDFNRAGVPLMEMRERARHPLARGGRGVPPRAARHAGVARRLRRQHGGGLAPLRRQHLAAPASARPSFGTKVEIKNMNSFRSLRARARATRSSGRRQALGRGRAHRAGDAPLGRGRAA